MYEAVSVWAPIHSLTVQELLCPMPSWPIIMFSMTHCGWTEQVTTATWASITDLLPQDFWTVLMIALKARCGYDNQGLCYFKTVYLLCKCVEKVCTCQLFLHPCQMCKSIHLTSLSPSSLCPPHDILLSPTWGLPLQWTCASVVLSRSLSLALDS